MKEVGIVKSNTPVQGRKETYRKPEIRSETVEIGVYGNYGVPEDPFPQLLPYFGLCPPCTPGE
jgi:hypothetical protein